MGKWCVGKISEVNLMNRGATVETNLKSKVRELGDSSQILEKICMDIALLNNHIWNMITYYLK